MKISPFRINTVVFLIAGFLPATLLFFLQSYFHGQFPADNYRQFFSVIAQCLFATMIFASIFAVFNLEGLHKTLTDTKVQIFEKMHLTGAGPFETLMAGNMKEMRSLNQKLASEGKGTAVASEKPEIDALLSSYSQLEMVKKIILDKFKTPVTLSAIAGTLSILCILSASTELQASVFYKAMTWYVVSLFVFSLVLAIRFVYSLIDLDQ
jgi:hypothetical protein